MPLSYHDLENAMQIKTNNTKNAKSYLVITKKNLLEEKEVYVVRAFTKNELKTTYNLSDEEVVNAITKEKFSLKWNSKTTSMWRTTRYLDFSTLERVDETNEDLLKDAVVYSTPNANAKWYQEHEEHIKSMFNKNYVNSNMDNFDNINKSFFYAQRLGLLTSSNDTVKPKDLYEMSDEEFDEKINKYCKFSTNKGYFPVITSDDAKTAFEITKVLGYITNENEIVTGKELDEMSSDELKEKVSYYRVFADVSKEHILRIFTPSKRVSLEVFKDTKIKKSVTQDIENLKKRMKLNQRESAILAENMFYNELERHIIENNNSFEKEVQEINDIIKERKSSLQQAIITFTKEKKVLPEGFKEPKVEFVGKKLITTNEYGDAKYELTFNYLIGNLTEPVSVKTKVVLKVSENEMLEKLQAHYNQIVVKPLEKIVEDLNAIEVSFVEEKNLHLHEDFRKQVGDLKDHYLTKKRYLTKKECERFEKHLADVKNIKPTIAHLFDMVSKAKKISVHQQQLEELLKITKNVVIKEKDLRTNNKLAQLMELITRKQYFIEELKAEAKNIIEQQQIINKKYEDIKYNIAILKAINEQECARKISIWRKLAFNFKKLFCSKKSKFEIEQVRRTQYIKKFNEDIDKWEEIKPFICPLEWKVAVPYTKRNTLTNLKLELDKRESISSFNKNNINEDQNVPTVKIQDKSLSTVSC